MKPKFEPTDDGLEIIDPIERHRYRLTMHESVDPTPVDTDRIQFPVDEAIEITNDMITLPTSDLIYIRGGDGRMVTEVRPDEQTNLPSDNYILDLSGPMKIYAGVNTSLSVFSDSNHTYISLGEATSITIGARSFHTRPAETITTTTDPVDVMKAVTTFGSALKTRTPERSYPTLRGHPPDIEIGDQFECPQRLINEDMNIQIGVPPTYKHIYTVTPLAYYLGAELISDENPKIVIDGDYSYSLNDPDPFEETVGRLLKHIFFLDCVVRTEGSTPLPLHERGVVESKIEFEIPDLYNKSLSEQLKTYLQVPFTVIEPHFPNWQLEIELKPNAEMIEFLPFFANDLAVIKIEQGNEENTPEVTEQEKAINEFTRSSADHITNSTRSSTAASSDFQSSVPSVCQVWKVDSGSKIESTTTLSAYHNDIGRKPREDPIEIRVVCNDQDMREELEEVNGVYGTRDELPFDVNVYYNLSTENLRSVLASESDFLHYIGHIDDKGFQCSDGKLDGESIESTGMKAFLLNACKSYGQGLHLINSGSVGGIVTFGDIINSGAINVGSTIARLLNQGYPLYAALDITRQNNIIGEQYRIVGNGITTIAQSKRSGPSVCYIDEQKEEKIISIDAYSTSWSGKGGVFTPYIKSVDEYYLTPGGTENIPVSDAELKEYLSREQIPIIIDNGVEWSKDYIQYL